MHWLLRLKTKEVRKLLNTALAISNLALAGCAGEQLTILPPVGPEPLERSYAGCLSVYSATEEFNDGGTMYYPHSDYRLYTNDGHFIKTVHNSISRNDETPERVVLPSGRYMVRAISEIDGVVEVRVRIAAGRTTVVNLENSRRGVVLSSPSKTPSTSVKSHAH